MIRRTIITSLAFTLLLLPIPSFAGGDQDFRAVVAAIETQYGVHHMRIPLLGFATFCVRIAGAPALKIAVFEHIRGDSGISAESLADSMQGVIGTPWRPFVRVRGRGELTMIYTNTDSKKLKMLIVSLDGDEATVVETKIKAADIQKWVRHPEDAGGQRQGSLSADAD